MKSYNKLAIKIAYSWNLPIRIEIKYAYSLIPFLDFELPTTRYFPKKLFKI